MSWGLFCLGLDFFRRGAGEGGEGKFVFCWGKKDRGVGVGLGSRFWGGSRVLPIFWGAGGKNLNVFIVGVYVIDIK